MLLYFNEKSRRKNTTFRANVEEKSDGNTAYSLK